MLFVALSFLIIANLATYFYLQKTKAQNLIFAERVKNLDSDLISQNQKLKTLEEDNNELRNFKGRYEHAQVEINGLYNEKDKYLSQINSLNYKILEFDKQSELLSQDIKRLEKEKLEWEKSRAAVLAELSEELMKKNHEQHAKLTNSNQENIAKITENLFKDFENVIAKIKNLDEKVTKSEEVSSQIKSALLTPKAAGDIAEITLENILKASGLKEKDSRDGVGDYILQSHFSTANQEGKRPDAILFLPDNNIIIIDSKSSSHFIDLFEARKQNDSALEKNILAKLKESMRKHADGLKKRNYAKFFEDEMRLNNFSEYKVLIIMFLQTEQMLDIISDVDSHFFQRNLENGLVVASPIGLVNLLNQAKFVIGGVKQQENIAELKTAIERLINNIGLVMRDSQEIGRSLNRSLGIYNRMASRFNRTIFNTIKNIEELGIDAKKSDMVKLLEHYDAEKNNDEDVS